MNILVKIGYKSFIIKNACFQTAEELMDAIVVDDVYDSGETKYIKTNDKVEVSMLPNNRLPTMTVNEWIDYKAKIAEEENGNKNSVE